jgi:hypothetical protein
MIQKLLFSWFFSKKHYAHALAQCSDIDEIRHSKALYACYALGLHRSVVDSVPRDSAWRGAFARAVSLAACGSGAQAAAQARQLIAGHSSNRLRIALAEALAPFAPELALEVIASLPAATSLHAALLLRTRQTDHACAILQRAMQSGQARQFPELNLLLSGAEPALPSQQLQYVNAFLAAYALTPLVLLDSARPPGPMNLASAVAHPPSRGPLVSVLMTAFNAGQRIMPAISSLQAQSYQDIEIIVIDDASTDDTGQIVQALAATDSRVIYKRLPRNVGTFVAKGIGLCQARGEFVTCHDSDDWSHPLRIERQVRPLIDMPKVVFTTSNWVRMQDDGKFYARTVSPLTRFNPASPMFRKELVQQHAGGWDSVRTGADSEFAARLTLVFGQHARHRVAQPLAFGAHRPGSLMTAEDTGYSITGMSPIRLQYWESWGHHHIAELRAGRKPYVPTDLLAPRRFAAPREIIVPPENVQACLAASCFNHRISMFSAPSVKP